MKKLIISTICIIGTLLSISFFVLPNLNRVSAEKEDYKSTEEVSIVYEYIIKNFNGNIAVFQNGKLTPFRVTDVSVSSLPLVDQQLLHEGIMIKDEDELTTMLEDYCS